MGTIYIDGLFKTAARPVKIVKGNTGGDPAVLDNYVTKEEFLQTTEDLTASIEEKDSNVVDETLIM